MEIKQLRAVLAIAETGTMTGAAALLHTVQPALSRQIRKLEDELGTPLFKRGHSGMELTEAGQILVQHARRIMREAEQARQLIQPRKDDVEGGVTIGLMRSIHNRYSNVLLSSVKERYRNIRLKIIIGYSSNIREWIKYGDADAAFLHLLRPSPGLEYLPILREHLCLVGLPEAGLSMSRPILFSSLQDVQTFIPGYISELQEIIESATLMTGVHPRLRVEASGASFQETLQRDGGFAILPSSSVLAEVENGRLTAAPVMELRRTLSVAFSMTRPPAAATKGVIDLLVDLMRINVLAGKWSSAEWIGPVQAVPGSSVRDHLCGRQANGPDF